LRLVFFLHGTNGLLGRESWSEGRSPGAGVEYILVQSQSQKQGFALKFVSVVVYRLGPSPSTLNPKL